MMDQYGQFATATFLPVVATAIVFFGLPFVVRAAKDLDSWLQ